MYDLIIIGAGPGGYHLAKNAANEKFKVAIIEANKFGGTCLNVGCIPSKAFLHIEKIVIDANESMDIGIVGEKLSIDQGKVIKYKDEKVKFLVTGTELGVKKSGAKIFKGKGVILKSEIKGEYRVEVNNEILTGKNLIIATGSEPALPPIPGLIDGHDKGYVITSTEALSLIEIPKELVIVGGGVIGLELGSYYSTAGSNVTIIEASSKIAGPTDNEITALFQDALEKWKGIKFILNAKVNKITENEVTYVNQNNEEIAIRHNKILVAVGRKPNTSGIGLENIGVFVERQGIAVDDVLKTNVPGVYAIGDVNGKLMLAHTAFAEADIVLANIKGINRKIDYNKIPVVIYGVPEISEIGITEQKAEAEGMDVNVKKLSMLYSGRFVIENAKFNGLIKVIIDKKTEEILGMSIFGNYASEIIIAGSILVGMRFSVEQIRYIVFAHPTVGEIIKDVILS